MLTETQKRARERYKRVVEMRNSGMTFPKIAAELGISTGRARQLFESRTLGKPHWKEEHHPSWAAGLRYEVAKRLEDAGFESREQVERSLEDGTFIERTKENCGMHYGIDTKKRREVREWLGAHKFPKPRRVVTIRWDCGVANHDHADRKSAESCMRDRGVASLP